MPKGIHSSIRVALAVAPKLHEQLKAWADYEGRPVASLCMYLIEQSLRQAQREGIAPSFSNEGVAPAVKVSTTVRQGAGEGKRFTQFYEDRVAEEKMKEERKKEKIFQLLQELTKD